MEQRRKLIYFKPMLVYDGDDFIKDIRTFVIYYRLNKQKYRRAFMKKISNALLCNCDPKIISELIYTDFKTELNIKHN